MILQNVPTLIISCLEAAFDNPHALGQRRSDGRPSRRHPRCHPKPHHRFAERTTKNVRELLHSPRLLQPPILLSHKQPTSHPQSFPMVQDPESVHLHPYQLRRYVHNHPHTHKTQLILRENLHAQPTTNKPSLFMSISPKPSPSGSSPSTAAPSP